MATLPQDLLQAYTSTDYIVHSSPTFILNISKHSKAFEQLAEKIKCYNAVFITAQNPYSTLKSPLRNKELSDVLEADIIQNGWTYFKGVGQSKDLTWKEDSFLVFGQNQKSAQELGQKYHQNAVVWIGQNSIPILILCT